MHDRQVKTAKRIGRYLMIVCILLVFAGCASLQTKPSDGDPGLRTITGIDVESVSDTEQVVIQATRELEYSSVKQKDPLGIIFYFPETRLGDIDTMITPGSGAVTSVNATPSADGENVRVEIALAADFEYEVDKSQSRLNVVITRGEAAAVQAAAPARTAEAPRQPRERMRQPEPMPVREPGTGNTAIIRQIDFSADEDGKSSVIIGTTEPADYEVRRVADRRLQLRMFDARLPEHRQNRPLITTRFDSAVDRVTPFQTPGLKDTVDFIFELREQVPYRVQRVDGQVIIHFDRSTVAPRPFAAADLPPWKQVLEASIDEMAAYDVRLPETTPVIEDAGLRALYDAYFGTPEYTGEKVALDFHETNIHNVFRILQPISGKNYAIDPDVTGRVSITMEKPVPWDQVLDLILTMNGLGMVEHGDIIRIARLSKLREEEQARQQRVRDLQQKIEDQKALEPMVTEYIPINYANAQTEILQHVREVLTKDRGRASVDVRNNQLIITDVRGSIQKARDVISRIDKVTPQVIIEARIVEVSTDFSREIGTQWNASRVDTSSAFGNWDYNVAMNHPVTASSGVSFSFDELPGIPGQTLLNAQLNAMEEQGEGKIISAPKIVTMNNKTAVITQGLEFPYRVATADRADVEFKDIDLRLEVTPQVTPDDRVSLRIHITKDDIDRILPTGEPSLTTNEARTELLVDNGSTIVIGGIRKEQESQTIEGFPVLKDIPILGWAFKSKVTFHEKRELLIFITPQIVQLEQRDMVSN